MTEDRSAASVSRRFGELGAGSPLTLEGADLWMLELPLRSPIVTAAGVHDRRPLVLVRLSVRADGDAVEGWGECAALAAAGYDPEDAARSFQTLEGVLLPALADVARRSHRLPPPAGLGSLARSAPAAPMAFAALEMAVADAHLRAAGRSFAALLGVEGRGVEIGAVVGILPSPAELVHKAAALAEEGYSRLKLKIAPGRDTAPIAALSGALPGLRLQADANGSYPATELDRLAALDRFGLLCLEQPFDRADLGAHGRLARRMQTPVCLDESVRSRQDIAHALAVGACSAVCLKPARLGGIAEALAVVEDCAATGTPLWMGGMLESGYGRGVITTIAALDGFSWPGDLSPAPTYLGADLVAAPELHRSPVSGALSVRPSGSPGMGPAPDLGTVTRHAVAHVRVAPG